MIQVLFVDLQLIEMTSKNFTTFSKNHDIPREINVRLDNDPVMENPKIKRCRFMCYILTHSTF